MNEICRDYRSHGENTSFLTQPQLLKFTLTVFEKFTAKRNYVQWKLKSQSWLIGSSTKTY